MKFKRLLGGLAFVALALLIRPVVAAVSTPQDLQGHTVTTADLVGGFTCQLDSTVGTGSVLCSSTTLNYGGRVFDMSGRGEIVGIIFSSVTVNNFVTFRDTNTANLSSPVLALVSPLNGNLSNLAPGSTVMVKFPIPIQYQSGLSVTPSAAISSPAVVTIIYRPFKQLD